MVTQRAAALVVFIGVLMLGLAFGLVIRSHLRERRWERQGEEATHFLKDLSKNGEGEALKSAEAVVIEKENETIYVDESADKAKIMISTGYHPEQEIVRRIVDSRRRRMEIASKIATTVRGILDIGGRRYWMKDWRISKDELFVNIYDVAGEKAGVFRLIGRNESLVTGEIHLADGDIRRIFDVFIPINHPNITNAFVAVRSVNPTNRELAVAAIDESYRNLTAASLRPIG
jgi:hypothetical protein